jgi:hypothetical protein
MRRNKLYTVNRGNKFALAGQMQTNLFNANLTAPTVQQKIDWADPVQLVTFYRWLD